jgi:ribosomal protein S18 acetylase RimI-like enzyme
VLFRPCTVEDFAALYAIEELCFQPPMRFGRAQMRRLIQDKNAATWIAEQGGQLCGFAIVEWGRERSGVPSDGSSSMGCTSEIVAYIQTIEVAPDRRGQGVGGELLHRVEASARAANAHLIWLHVDAENAAALRLYEAHGYRIEGRQEKYYPHGRAALICLKALNTGPSN